uniref:Vacuolar protein sorting/targeting protein 10 n=1 Tax=Podospora anserina (strain S / ATCC MYA-4624 / DSM 980 / FGSC 10383) TaxID=515849 RepID=A0A090CF68_PODAN|nr:Putative vacuolar protein sorting/targeting protein PEP1 precursor [Podospora anserina S mat+]
MKAWRALQATALLASALWATPLAAAKDRPTFHSKEFENIPMNINYFADSDVVLFQDIDDGNVYLSNDAGAKWERVDAVPEGKAVLLTMHEFDSKRAYILTEGSKHYRTTDRGKNWEKFDSGVDLSIFRPDMLAFHADDPDRIIFNGMRCHGFQCQEVTTYTTDGFKTKGKALRDDTDGCWWAKGSELFTTGEDDLDKDRVICIVRDKVSPLKQDQRLKISDNFFKGTEEAKNIQEFEPNLDTDKVIQGVVSIAIVKKWILVATTSLNTDEMALFVTDDTKKWSRAAFPAAHDSHDHRLAQNAYTVLESTNYSIQVDVRTSNQGNPMGVMYSSNSKGNHFTENAEHTNRNKHGHVDFEKIAGIQGVYLVNKVKNWEEVEKKAGADKEIYSEITFDDGRTFEKITADGKRIHLHSVTDLSNIGRVFSSAAPGIVMGVGNTGDELKSYWDKGNLYVSDDAGKTWTKALDGPHKYEFGDQGSILVAVKDSKEEDISEISYSLDHGQKWKTESLPDDLKIRPYILTTSQDSTSLKFLLIGKTKKSPEWRVLSIDFEGLHEDTCKEDDMEVWSARVDKDGKPTCLMGHTQSFHRRKKDAKCFLKQEFKHAVAETKDCDCTEQDYECDFNFERDEDGECVKKGKVLAPEGACKDKKPDDTFKGTSGYRKIPGNTCKDTDKMKDKYKDKEWKCKDAIGGNGGPTHELTGKVEQTKHVMEGKKWDGFEKHYLERGDSSTGTDETVIMRPLNKAGPILVSFNHGKDWETPKKLEDEEITAIIPHQYFKDAVFFLTSGKKVFVTMDRCKTFQAFDAPTKPDNDMFPLAFHPDHKDWLIWMGKKCDDGECYGVAHATEDPFAYWRTIGKQVRRCEFTGSSAYKFEGRKENQILCLKHEKEDKAKPLVLASSNDWFKNEEVYGKNVKDFATMAEFIVVAAEDAEKKTLQASASLDGKNYANAHFPHGFEVTHQHAYTVLDSSTHAVNLFVATSMEEGRQYGTIIKSNSNGTSYVVSVRNVNCDESYYVDFEKMLGLEGVAVVNVVANSDDKKGTKKLQTQITHNDGAQWAYLPAPVGDNLEPKLPCHDKQGSKDCALHIHGYTERRDHGKTHSSQGAVGIMFGWGNTGDSLGPLKEADTYMTTDAGKTWKRVMKGTWTWAIGDQGGILILAQTTASASRKQSNKLFYSFDRGNTWKEHEFSEKEVELWDVTTVRSGGSHSFLLWGKDEDDKAFTMKLNFKGFANKDCQFDKDHPENGDYELWSPEHPVQKDGCLFGHKSKYLRKKIAKDGDVQCWNTMKMSPLYGKEDCECQREDFECDYNFEMDPIGQCSLVNGLSPMTREQWCSEHPDAIEFFPPSGYRRIPLTTCKGGKTMDEQSEPVACPQKEEEYEKKHRRSGWSIFFAVVIPVVIAAGAGWYVWRNWNGKFGQIRLGENGTSTHVFDEGQPWVKYPIIAISGVVAVVVAIPVVAGAVWRVVKGGMERVGLLGGAGGGSRGRWSRLGGGGGGWGSRRFTTRDSFARGAGGYDIVDGDDEGELLGDEESDEEQV